MAEVLTVVFFAAAIGGAIVGLVGVLAHVARRRASLLTAGVCFAVAGVLGILSIGIIFLALSIASFVVAFRTGDGIEHRGRDAGKLDIGRESGRDR